MSHGRPLRRLAAVLVVCGTLLTPATALAAPTPVPTPTPTASPTPGPAGDGWTVEEALRFWTPERISSATDPAPAPPAPLTSRRPRAVGQGREGGGDTSVHFDGVDSVGMLFAVDKDMRAHYCSAASVHGSGRDLILTAGHCVNSKAVFVPRYDPAKPLAGQPHGIWPVEEWFTDPRYQRNSRAADSDLDFAFGRVRADGDRKLEDVVGGNTVARTPSAANDVTVIGYPSVGHNPEDRPVRCATRTAALAGFHQMRIDCAGMWGGVSGGPWFSRLDAKGTGEIIGNVGGFNGGGPAVPSSDPLYNRISYSPLYGDRFLRLYEDAQQDRHSDPGPYVPPAAPFTPGTPEKWRNARLMTSGNFTGANRDDLLVVWTDGSASLFRGSDSADPAVPFSARYEVAKAGSVWKHAQAISAGSFRPGTDGVVVRWVDGEVTEYAHADERGFHDEKQLIKAEGWQKAKLITVGRFNGTARDDLLVVWSYGTVTIYPDLDTRGVSKGTHLVVSDKTWTYAEQVGAGEFTGGRTSDLIVRWKDGETTIHPAVDEKGFHGETKVRPAKSPWVNAALVAPGAFTGTGATRDDVLVRWTDGALSVYPQVDAAGTHREVQIVG
ncbi:trypsin-like peptidase domain-containing protein [Streptomyces sp. LP05-1]|uniref:Trypsin-like peptidase domain-containing protein n=1 Tax=Streptomyces pyxinae TaxID=2970734 RepID=A0ABT2C9L7_9ACTN|nr:trypsin-like peptidase domain-containing protein [Streptomyces sp. LP05-1]MCS0634089.1 trypsin-like peptidase domain-containing protein [Streptomyces sp. LP05-1]